MEKKVLIASSHQAFADLLRHSLAGSRAYTFQVVLTIEDLHRLPDQHGFDLVILDADVPDHPLVKGVAAFRSENKNLKLVVFPPDNRADHPGMAGLCADAFLKKPFYLPELQAVLKVQLNPPEIPSSERDFGQDENRESARYQQILKVIQGKSQAAAILLVKDDQPVAYVGEVIPEAPQLMMKIIMPHWNAERRSDVVRFKQLQEGGRDYLFYAAAINPALILMMMYERTISLTAARLHTTAVIRYLQNPPAAWLLSQPTPSLQQHAALGSTETAPPPTALLMEEEPDWLVEEDDSEGLDEAEITSLEALLAAMPTPDPQASEAAAMHAFAVPWQAEIAAESVDETVPADELNPARTQVSDSPLIGLQPLEGEAERQEITQSVRRTLSESRTIPADLPPVDPLEDTAPRSLDVPTKPIVEAHAPGVSSLNYTSVLLPCLPSQFLAGELAEWLGVWLPQLCVAYGWRLERMSIRPRYVQWTVQVPPTVSPGYMVRILREETSRRIFKRQPELQDDNSLNDFWAPGYLVMSGFLPPTQQMLDDYIQQTRRRQGFEA